MKNTKRPFCKLSASVRSTRATSVRGHDWTQLCATLIAKDRFKSNPANVSHLALTKRQTLFKQLHDSKTWHNILGFHTAQTLWQYSWCSILKNRILSKNFCSDCCPSPTNNGEHPSRKPTEEKQVTNQVTRGSKTLQAPPQTNLQSHNIALSVFVHTRFILDQFALCAK